MTWRSLCDITGVEGPSVCVDSSLEGGGAGYAHGGLQIRPLAVPCPQPLPQLEVARGRQLQRPHLRLPNEGMYSFSF